MNKTLKIILISFLSILAISILVIMILLMNHRISLKQLSFGFSNKVSNELVYTSEYDIKDININVDMSKVELKDTTDSKIKLEIYSDYEGYKVDDSNILDINVPTKKCHFFCFNLKQSKVVLYIPVEYSNNITIDSDYGDIDVGEIPNAKLDIDSDFGDMTIGSVYNLKVAADFGDIRVESVNNYLNIKEDFGDIRIDQALINKNSKIVSNFGDIKIYNINDIYVDAKTDFGDVNINNYDKNSNITLTVRNDFGDIDIGKKK